MNLFFENNVLVIGLITIAYIECLKLITIFLVYAFEYNYPECIIFWKKQIPILYFSLYIYLLRFEQWALYKQNVCLAQNFNHGTCIYNEFIYSVFKGR